MAYAKINKLLEGDDQQKSNIFSGDEQGFALTGQSEVSEDTPSAPEAKTSTEGTVAAGSGGQQQKSSALTQSDETKNSPGRDLIQRNIGKQKAPKTFSDIEGRLTGAQQQLEEEGQSYLQGQKQKASQKYGRTIDDYESAISDETADLGGLRNQAAAPSDQFEYQTETNIIPNIAAGLAGGQQSAGALDEAVRGYMRREQGPQYSQAESDLDLALLKRQPGYRDQLRNLGGMQQELTQRAGTIGGDLEQQALEAQEQIRQSELDKALNYYSGQASDIQSAQEQEFQDYLASLNPQEALLSEAAGDPFITQMLQNQTVNAADYLKGYNPGEEWRAFVDQGEADRFNRIQQLLQGNEFMEAATQPGGGIGLDIESLRNDYIAPLQVIQGQSQDAQSRAMADILAESGAKDFTPEGAPNIQDYIAGQQPGSAQFDMEKFYQDALQQYRNQVQKQFGGLQEALQTTFVPTYTEPVPTTIPKPVAPAAAPRTGAYKDPVTGQVIEVSAPPRIPSSLEQLLSGNVTPSGGFTGAYRDPRTGQLVRR